MPLTNTCSLHLQLSGSTDRHGIHQSPCHRISHRVEHFIEYLCRLHASYLYLLIASPTFRLDRSPWDPLVTMSPDFLKLSILGLGLGLSCYILPVTKTNVYEHLVISVDKHLFFIFGSELRKISHNKVHRIFGCII